VQILTSSYGNGRHAGEVAYATRAEHLHGRVAIGERPVAQLPKTVVPQAQTVPSLFSARLCSPPPAIAVTPLSPLTCTGVLLLVNVPLPNCPEPFNPQAQTVP